VVLFGKLNNKYMKTIVDLESIGSGERLTRDQIKVPGNFSKPESIQKWLDENADEYIEEEYRKRALVPHKCQVVCVALKSEGGEMVYYSNEEKEVLEWLDAAIKEITHTPYEIEWVGVNIRSFDIVILKQRAWKYGLKSLSLALDQKVFDIMDIFTGSKYKDYLVSKDDMCKFFGIPVEGDSGSEVYGWWQNKEYDKISAHCLNDVRKEFELYQKISI
jgi:hypothetical protein